MNNENSNDKNTIINSDEEIIQNNIQNGKQNDKNNMTFINSIKENLLSWLFIFISISIISYPNLSNGFVTFFVLLLLAYIVHAVSHYIRNVFTILHHYHHENTNLFSHYAQILMELTFPVIFYPIYLQYDTIFLDPWVIFLFVLFYSSVHNINYAIFRVNDVHYLHHQFINTNIGPDICDVIFNTKNPHNTCVENTNHYIPNIIIGTLIVLFIKYLYESNDKIKNMFLLILKAFFVLSTSFLVISSIYLIFNYG